MQNDKTLEEMIPFMMPSNALDAADIIEGDTLQIKAKRGKIVIKKVKKKAGKCRWDCNRCCSHFPCCEIYE